MALIASEDYVNKRIYLGIDSVGVEVLPMDIYKEHRQRRRLNSNNERFFSQMVSAFGNEQIGTNKFTPRFTNLAEGVRIVPYDTTQSLLIRGSLVNTRESLEGRDLFDRSSLVASVDIDYQPPQVEIITVSSGSGLSNAQDTSLSRIESISNKLDSLLEDTGSYLRLKQTALEQAVDSSLINAIKAKTDQLTFSIANQLDATFLSGTGDINLDLLENNLELLLDLNMLSVGKTVTHSANAIVVGENEIVITVSKDENSKTVSGTRIT